MNARLARLDRRECQARLEQAHLFQCEFLLLRDNAPLHLIAFLVRFWLLRVEQGLGQSICKLRQEMSYDAVDRY